MPDENQAGLFGHTHGATISDLTLESGYVTGFEYVGALIGWAESATITNVVSHLDVTGLGIGLEAIKVAVNLPTMKGGGMTHNPEIGLIWAQTAKKDAQGDSSIGTEIYINTNCTLDQNLSANVGLAFLSAGDALSATVAKAEDQLKLEGSLTFKF